MELCANLLNKLYKIAVILNFLAFFCFYLKNFHSWIRIRADSDPHPCFTDSMSGCYCHVTLFCAPPIKFKIMLSKLTPDIAIHIWLIFHH